MSCHGHPECPMTAGYYLGGGMYVCWLHALFEPGLMRAIGQTGQKMQALPRQAKYIFPRCNDCGKTITPEMNDEECPKTLAWHGKHSIVVMDVERPGAPNYLSVSMRENNP